MAKYKSVLNLAYESIINELAEELNVDRVKLDTYLKIYLRILLINQKSSEDFTISTFARFAIKAKYNKHSHTNKLIKRKKNTISCKRKRRKRRKIEKMKRYQILYPDCYHDPNEDC